MYLCFEPQIMYGCMVDGDDGESQQIDSEYLDKHDIEVSTTDIIRGYACAWVYGVTASFNDEKVFVSKKERKRVDDFARLIGANKPGFVLVIEGDYEYKCKYYIPNEK